MILGSSEKGGCHGLTRLEFCTNSQLIHFQIKRIKNIVQFNIYNFMRKPCLQLSGQNEEEDEKKFLPCSRKTCVCN